MDVDTVTVRPEVSLDSVPGFLRTLEERVPENTDALILVNREDQYPGILPLTRLVAGKTSDIVAEAMRIDFKPINVNLFDIDPALAGSVFLTTVTDIIGFIVFLGLATHFLL